MASQQPAPSAQVVGNAFVHQYYHILHQSPDLVYRFYLEGSKLGRSEADGAMSSVTTMQAINDKILSMDYSEFRAEIKTVDAQESLNGGVIVLVTGFLTGKDNVPRNFTQSFFLATQDKGYFVLNDIFRYVEEADLQRQGNQDLENGTVATISPYKGAETPTQEQQPLEQPVLPLEHPVSPPEEEEEVYEEKIYNTSDNDEGLVVVKEPVDELKDEVPNSSPAVVTDTRSTTVQEEAPKKSYASIVKDMKENVAPISVPSPAPSRPTLANPERQAAPAPTPTPAPAPEVPTASSSATETSSVQEAEADGHSIYIKSLPLNATYDELEEEFKRFGPIKPGGIQIRSHKQQGFCFGFVEFEVADAVQSAIEASPIVIGGRQAFVEEKRPSGSRVNTRGRFLPSRGGGYRNDGVRGRGSYGGGRGYGRGDYSNRTDFGGRGGGRGGSSNRGGDVGYQRVDHTRPSSGRGSRPGSRAADTSPNSVTPRVSAPA